MLFNIEEVFITFLVLVSLDMFMYEGMILHKWYKFLEWFSEKGALANFIAKPLGLCTYCFGTWVAMFMHIWLYGLPVNIETFVSMLIYGVSTVGFFTLWVVITNK